MATKTKKKRKQKRINITSGKVYVNATFNNTIITVTDDKGEILVWGSSGKSGFHGTRRATPYAATVAAEETLRRASEQHGIKNVDVYIKGPGAGRDAVLRVIKSIGLRMNLIADVTPMPHNGPRARKKRRV